MIVLKYKKNNQILMGTFNIVSLVSSFEDGKLNISYMFNEFEEKREDIDEYSVYQNGTLIEHQDKRDYIKEDK